MKKIIFLILAVLLSNSLLFAFSDATLDDHSKISRLSSFRVMGNIDLRIEKDKNATVAYTTLNHEGGMSVVVLEVLEKGTVDGKDGRWLYVRLTSPMWVSSGEWIEKYRNFLIFLPDSTTVFDFEE